jgi:DNA-binding transcriptional ArsR family regulator
LKGAAPVFAALGDETRLMLLSRLCGSGPASIAGLTAGAKVTRQAVTKHLHVLAGAGLVRSVRRGRERRWELEPAQLDAAHHWLEVISRRWDSALDRLRAAVE